MFVIQKTEFKNKRFLHRQLTVEGAEFYQWKQEQEGAYAVPTRGEGKELIKKVAPNVPNKLLSFRPI